MSTIKTANFQHPSATNPAIVLAADGTAAATVSAINSGPLAGFRNAIINGNFDIWQRGTSVAGFGMVTADRWTTRSAGFTGGTLTQSRQAFTLGQTEVPGEPKFYWRLVFTGATGTPFVEQRIEDIRSYAGQTVTMSFWARRSSASSTCYVDMVQNFGTGGSPSAPVTTSSSTFTVGTSWTYITQTFTIPSVSGKTLGTDDNDYLAARIWCGGTGSFTFELAQVQIEPGPVATPFERRPIGTELALCQRYYEIGRFFHVEGYVVSNGTNSGSSVFFKAEKRVPPVVTQQNLINTGTFPATPQQANINTHSFLSYRTGTSAAAGQYEENWTASAEL